MLRIVAKVAIFNGVAYQTSKFNKSVYLGDPINIVNMLGDQGAQELFISFVEGYDEALAKRLLTVCRMPVCVSGVPFESMFILGADKYVLGFSSASGGRARAISEVLGLQAVTLSVDYKILDGVPMVFTGEGRKKCITKLDEYLHNINIENFGELILNSVDRDGMKCGSDIGIEEYIPSEFRLPVLLAGGATRAKLGDLEGRRADGVVTSTDISLHGSKGAVLINYPVEYRIYENL